MVSTRASDPSSSTQSAPAGVKGSGFSMSWMVRWPWREKRKARSAGLNREVGGQSAKRGCCLSRDLSPTPTSPTATARLPNQS